jgi:ubiquinol-cytochrome c reductase cytochrome c1 subunit
MSIRSNIQLGLRLFLVLFILFSQLTADAKEYPIQLENPNIDTHDLKSVRRGAKGFATYCLVCHSLDLLSHDPIARSAGITLNKMPKKNQRWWFGSAPPDLSLIGRVHSVEWLYTYLHVFYKDTTRHIGTNNLLFENVNMPNPFLGIQGEQVLLVKKAGLYKDTPLFTRKVPYYTILDLTREGSMPPDKFDVLTKDIVNFLAYASDPKRFIREDIGIWVLVFLAIMIVLVYLLKRLYWKQIKNK